MCTVIIYSTSKSQGDRISCMWNVLWQTIPDYVRFPLCSGPRSFPYWLELLINSSCKWQNIDGRHGQVLSQAPSPGAALRETGCWIVGRLRGCKIQGKMLLLPWGHASCCVYGRPRKGDVVIVVRPGFQGPLSDQGFVSQQVPSFHSFKR